MAPCSTTINISLDFALSPNTACGGAVSAFTGFHHTMSPIHSRTRQQPATPVGGPAQSEPVSSDQTSDTDNNSDRSRPHFCLQAAMGVVWKVDTVAHRSIPRSFILMKELRPGWVWEMGVLNIADQVRWKKASGIAPWRSLFAGEKKQQLLCAAYYVSYAERAVFTLSSAVEPANPRR